MIIGQEFRSRKRVLRVGGFYEYRAPASNQTSKQIAHKSSIHRHSKSFNWPKFLSHVNLVMRQNTGCDIFLDKRPGPDFILINPPSVPQV